MSSKSEFDNLLAQCNYMDRFAIIDSENVLTYEQLCDEIKLFSHELNNKGITQGDRIAILLPNSMVNENGFIYISYLN